LAGTVLVLPIFQSARISPVLGFLFTGLVLGQLGCVNVPHSSGIVRQLPIAWSILCCVLQAFSQLGGDREAFPTWCTVSFV
jgi:hypothetical protein